MGSLGSVEDSGGYVRDQPWSAALPDVLRQHPQCGKKASCAGTARGAQAALGAISSLPTRNACCASVARFGVIPRVVVRWGPPMWRRSSVIGGAAEGLGLHPGSGARGAALLVQGGSPAGPWLNNIVRAKKPRRLPVVLTSEETRAVLAQLDGVYWLIGHLLYGSGLRLMECLRLRVQDLDFDYRQILGRDGKGGKDRMTMLPQILVGPLQAHLLAVRERHQVALREGYGGVELPDAIARKYPRAAQEWLWQYVFPAAQPTVDPRSGVRRRHHIYEDSVQRHMKAALRRAGIERPASCHNAKNSLSRVRTASSRSWSSTSFTLTW